MVNRLLCGRFLLAFGFLALPAHADLKVTQRADVVFLNDGTRVVGTVLAEGIKAVVLIVDGQERLVRREHVLRIEKGPDVGKRVEGFTADPVNGLKVITGRGYRETESAEGDGDEGGNGKKRKSAKKGRGAKRSASGRRKPAGRGSLPKNVKNLKPKDLERYARTDPRAKQMIETLGGPAAALAFIKSNPQLASRINAMLNSRGAGARSGRERPNRSRPERRRRPHRIE